MVSPLIYVSRALAVLVPIALLLIPALRLAPELERDAFKPRSDPAST